MQNRDGKPPFIKKVKHDQEVPVNQPFTINLNADWPTPSWDHEETDIDVDEENNKITISYLGRRRPGVALQVIKTFQVNFEIELPSKGIWTLIIKGKNEDWESTVTVI